MIQKAHAHAEVYGIAIGRDRSVSDDARAVVNWLRHEHTDYDDDQTAERHRLACETIAAAFPWLATECARQIERRTEEERHRVAEAQLLTDLQAQERAERHALVKASKTAIGRMAVGQKVLYKRGSYIYEAVVTKVGRSKVTVAYQVKTGRERDRTATVHAALLTSVDNT